MCLRVFLHEYTFQQKGFFRQIFEYRQAWQKVHPHPDLLQLHLDALAVPVLWQNAAVRKMLPSEFQTQSTPAKLPQLCRLRATTSHILWESDASECDTKGFHMKSRLLIPPQRAIHISKGHEPYPKMAWHLWKLVQKKLSVEKGYPSATWSWVWLI